MWRIPMMPIFLLWIGLTSIVLFLFVSGQPPFHFLSSRQLILYVEEMKLFFLMMIMPLLIKSSPNQDASPYQANLLFYASGFVQIIVFLLLLLPLSVFCAETGGAKYSYLGLVHLLYLVIGGVIIGLRWREESSIRLPVPRRNGPVPKLHSGSGRWTNLMRFYYLIVFGLSMGGSLFYYLRLELFNQKTSFILYLNPFWLIWRMLY